MLCNDWFLLMVHFTVETVEEQIVRHLTGKRIKELDKMLAKTREEYKYVEWMNGWIKG